ncbi:MAG: hypothetical protein JHD32_16465 [Sphingobium sp.]|uniref:hypothetical protein n=1 Tax=Sphingobium cupriresistens TaxID=1132417 RepID=UPI001A3369B3|nr:hypothetical protein [Sphingobium sp.]
MNATGGSIAIRGTHGQYPVPIIGPGRFIYIISQRSAERRDIAQRACGAVTRHMRDHMLT